MSKNLKTQMARTLHAFAFVVALLSPVVAFAESFADLQPAGAPAANLRPGRIQHFSWGLMIEVKNEGSAQTRPVLVKVDFQTASGPLTRYALVGWIQPGQSGHVAVWGPPGVSLAPAQCLASGSYTVTVDARNQIAETNEQDNAATSAACI